MKTGIMMLGGMLLAVLPAASFAAGAADTVPEPLHGDILQLIKMTQATNMAELVGNAVAQQLANNLRAADPTISPKAFSIIEEETSKIFANPATVNGLIERLMPVFAEYYTDQDVRGMIAFYKTPLGQKMIRTNPKIAQASLQIGEAWGRELAPELVKHIRARFKQEGIKVNEPGNSSKKP
jgi:hypothetical protein